MEQVTRQKILTIRQTATEYGVAEFAVRRWVKQQKFPVFYSGTRCYINRAVFESYLDGGGPITATGANPYVV